MSDNVIELIVKTIDQASQGIKAISGQVDVLGKSTSALKSIFETVAAGFTLDKLVETITEAQQATADLDRQFANLGGRVGVTEADMLSFADETSKATTLTKASLEEAQANLLNYTSLTGQAFLDARDLVADLAAKMGGDAADAATLLGRALQNPVSGIRLLAQVGVTLTQSQRATIASLEQTGGAAQATAFVMDTLRDHIRGAAEASTNTLGGALKQLKNSFTEAIAGDGSGANGFIDSIHNLNDEINDSSFTEGLGGIATLVTGIGNAFAIAGEPIERFIRSVSEGLAHALNGADTPQGQLEDQKKALEELIAVPDQDPAAVASYVKQLAVVQAQLDKLTASAEAAGKALNQDLGGAAFGAKNSGAFGADTSKKTTTLFDALEKPVTFGPNAFALQHGPNTDALKEFYQSELDDLGDSIDQANTDFAKHQAERTDLLAAGLLTPSTAAQQQADELNKLLPEITTSAKQIKVPLDDIQKEGKEVAQDLTGAFTSFFESGSLNARTFGQDMIKVFDQIFAKAASQDIVNLLGLNKLFDQSGTSGSLVGGLFGALGNLFGGSGVSGVAPANANNDSTSALLDTGLAAMFGFAGGGQVSGGPMWVGEDGPELFEPGVSGTVMNQRQMAFAGGSGAQGLVYAPVNNINLTTDNSDKNTAALMQFMTVQQTQMRAEFERKLARNGIKLK